MAHVPLSAVALPAALEFTSIKLHTKPTASLQCSQLPPSGHFRYSNTLLVFVNGLMAPQTLWLPVMALVLRRLKEDWSEPCHPQMLAYDRYGQGKTTDADPQDTDNEPGFGHDVLDVVRDLHQLIKQTSPTKAGDDNHTLEIVFVANSIGCAVARLYAQEYPGTVAGMILLDSIMANSDFVSIFPDPDGNGFDESSLPAGATSDMLRTARKQVQAIFHPSVRNPEGLNRKTLATLLPHADKPLLAGPRGKAPFVTVVGHDPEHFANENLSGRMAMPLVMSMAYMNPVWHNYNVGLLSITDSSRSKGPVIAKACGHFIQRDDPQFVANEICDMLRKIADENSK